jgi:hypothetical protein
MKLDSRLSESAKTDKVDQVMKEVCVGFDRIS